jgi:UDP-glucose 4-epimerase
LASVLVTGAAGFIGSTLVRRLLHEGATVRCLDDLSSGRLENLEDVRSKIEFLRGNVECAEDVRRACAGVSLVFHHAAIPSVPVSMNDPVGTNGPNLQGTLLLLEAARQAGVQRLVYASSSAIYGDSPEMPKIESMLPDPISPYAVQKLAGEHYLRSYARCFGLETVALRYFNVFGPRQDPGSQYSGVLARFINQMVAGEAPTIFGDGSTSRDFVFIDNVVQANLLAAKAPAAASGRAFNIATGTSTTLLQAYEAVAEIVGYRGQPTIAPERNGDIRHSVADISLARKMLGYAPEVDFRTGLERTIAWSRSVAASPMKQLASAGKI